jgi:hypothetical protein
MISVHLNNYEKKNSIQKVTKIQRLWMKLFADIVEALSVILAQAASQQLSL